MILSIKPNETRELEIYVILETLETATLSVLVLIF